MAAVAKFRSVERSLREREEWVEHARVKAILGGMRASLPAVKSGLRCYVAFVGTIVAPCCVCACALRADAISPGARTYFPPQLKVLLAWSVLFRCSGTFSNYLSYVKTGCLLVEGSVKVIIVAIMRLFLLSLC